MKGTSDPSEHLRQLSENRQRWKNGNQYQLKNGECMDPDGNRYMSQEKFHEKIMHRNREKMDKEKGIDKMKGNKREKKNRMH